MTGGKTGGASRGRDMTMQAKRASIEAVVKEGTSEHLSVTAGTDSLWLFR